jgi:hypothetical protein
MGSPIPFLAGTYDPNDLILIAAGIPIVSGFAEGSMVEWGRDKKANTDGAGTQGEVWRIVNRDKRGFIKFFLHQNSMLNDVLSAAMIANEAAGRFGLVAPSSIVIRATGVKIAAAESWLESFPDGGYSDAMEKREWVVRCAALLPVVGGVALR